MIRMQWHAAISICGDGICWSRPWWKQVRGIVKSIFPAATGTISGLESVRQEAAKSARAVDLETLPLYVRAGSILPLGPVKQYTGESSDLPLSVSIYPGADAGATKNHLR